MKALEIIRKAFSSDSEDPSSEQLSAAAAEVAELVAALKKQLRDSELRRREVLVVGTDAQLDAHDDAHAKLERRLAASEARLAELTSARRRAEEGERLSRMPQRLVRVQQALESWEAADRAARQALAELADAHRDLSVSWTLVPHHRLHELPQPPGNLGPRLKRALGEGTKVPKRPPDEDPNAPVAVLRPDGTWDLKGEWTAEQRRRLTQAQRPDVRSKV